MEYKNFEIKLFIQILLILAVSLLIGFCIQKENLQFATIYFFIIIFIQGTILYNYLNRKNQRLLDFIKTISLKDADDKLLNNSYDVRDQLLNKISYELSNKYQNLELEKILKEYYLYYVLESVHVGIIAMNTDKIIFQNSYLKNLFKKDVQTDIYNLNQLSSNLRLILDSVDLNVPKLHAFSIDGENTFISIHLSFFKIDEKEIKLYTFYNVNRELQENETNTWQEVIRVISHEIMNSISPIKSLSSTMYDTLQEELKNDIIQKNQIEGILEGIEAIEKRSSNLTDFVTNYKKLTRIPKPENKNFLIQDLFKRLDNLFRSELQQYCIKFNTKTEPQNLKLNADEKLIEQILINLITNSIHSLKHSENKKIELIASLPDSRIKIEVIDNGLGIAPDEINKIFLPFYTTKEQGSGIGLSLARQIMRLHGGSISVQSVPESKTTFTITF